MRVITNYQPSHQNRSVRKKPRKARRRLGLVLLILITALGVFWYQDNKAVSPGGEVKQADKAEVPAAPPQPDKELETIFANWAQAHPERQWSIVVRGLESDKRYASYKPAEVYGAASIYKLFLTYLLFKDISVDDISDISVSSQGRTWPLGYCLDMALRVSDNPCAWAIGNRTGWETSNPELAGAGFSATKLDVANGHKSSAEDTADLLEGMYKATYYDKAERDYLLNILKKQSYNQGIKAGCTNCEVANKTGELPGLKHDAGIVWHSGGKKAYLIVVFSDGATYAQIAELAGQIHARMVK